MRNLLQSLELLRSEPEVILRSPFARLLDAQKQCAPLINARDTLRSKAGAVKPSVPPLDPDKVWHRFEAGQGDLDALNDLELRALCSAEEFAIRPKFVEALQSRPERLNTPRCLYALVNSYFTRWRDMHAAESLENILKNAINNAPRITPAIQRWRSAQSLFSPAAAESLAQFIVDRHSQIHAVLRLQYVGAGTRLALQTHARTAELGAKRFCEIESRSDEGSNLRYLEWLVKDVLTDTLLPGALHAAVSSLILSRSAEQSESFQKTLQGYIQGSKWLGDPRLRQYAPNWREMEPQAEQRFLSWLAKESILFFFNTILPPNDENRRRADFWLKYYKQIKDFQVAVSDQDYWILQRKKATADIPLHSRVQQGSTSAFLMKFRGYAAEFVIVEFSETGNATHIYERSVFESTKVNLRTPIFLLNKHLKQGGRLDRIIHIGQWEYGAAQKLAGLGIGP